MPASGTYSFNPDLGSLGAYCLGRSDVRRPAITAGHLADVQMAANLVLVDLALDPPQLWDIQLASIALVQGTATYTLPANLMWLTDAYIETNIGGQPQDRVIFGVSRTVYAAYPNKTLQQPPTVYWWDRVQPPTVTLYPTPDGNGPYTLFYYAMYRDQDAVVPGATTLDIPYRAMSMFADALAAKLALTYKPDRFQLLDQVAQRSYGQFNRQEREDVTMQIIPGLAGYYRRR